MAKRSVEQLSGDQAHGACANETLTPSTCRAVGWLSVDRMLCALLSSHIFSEITFTIRPSPSGYAVRQEAFCLVYFAVEADHVLLD